MKSMKNIKRIIAILALGCVSSVFAQEEAWKHTGEVYPLWEDAQMPGNACLQQEQVSRKYPNRWMNNVSKPRLELFKASSEQPTGLVIVCPGGGYVGLSVENEGSLIAQWLVSKGINAAVLYYRVPENMHGALQDIQRAIRMTRANAKKWNINPDKICVIGFSAGANLCARASTNFKKTFYKPVDDIDKLSAKPSHTCLIYPAYCSDKAFVQYKIARTGRKFEDLDYNSEYELAKNLPVSEDTPPAFIVQTLEDKNYVNASLAYFLALKKAGVDANLFLCDKGPHGYGLGQRIPDKLVSMWPELFEKWLTINKFKGDK